MRGRPNSARAALIGAACLALVAALLLPATAGADLLTPEAGPTENAVKTDTLYKIVLFIGLAVIGLVWGALFYTLFRYRARRGRAAPQIRGNTAARAGLDDRRQRDRGRDHDHHATSSCPTSATRPRPGPASVAEARGQNAAVNQPPPPGGKGLEIQVSGQQYLWRYQYPNGTFSFHEMVVPADRPCC